LGRIRRECDGEEGKDKIGGSLLGPNAGKREVWGRKLTGLGRHVKPSEQKNGGSGVGQWGKKKEPFSNASKSLKKGKRKKCLGKERVSLH